MGSLLRYDIRSVPQPYMVDTVTLQRVDNNDETEIKA